MECGPEGLEVKVVAKICELLVEDKGIVIQPVFVPMDNKKELIEDCGASTRLLIEKGCDRVVILWDERPAWPNSEEKFVGPLSEHAFSNTWQ